MSIIISNLYSQKLLEVILIDCLTDGTFSLLKLFHIYEVLNVCVNIVMRLILF